MLTTPTNAALSGRNRSEPSRAAASNSFTTEAVVARIAGGAGACAGIVEIKPDGSSDAPLSRTVGPADCKGLGDRRRSMTSLAFLLAFHLALSNIRLILSCASCRKRDFPKGAEQEDKVSGECRLGREGSRLRTSNRGLIPCSFASIGSRLVVCKVSELQNEHVNHLSGSLPDLPLNGPINASHDVFSRHGKVRAP